MKLLLGGSPCTHWSIAQTRNRETQPEGLGWELFRNYLIARERYGPDFYLYENNKSMAPAIRTSQPNMAPASIAAACALVTLICSLYSSTMVWAWARS